MIQEDKDLLLKDLCGRLPYDVKVQVFNCGVKSVETLYQIDLDGYISTLEGDELKYSYKPYLFPLSSMTEEQSKIYHELIHGMFGTSVLINLEELMNFFYKNHFDYRGLIPKGLAIDATNLNIY